MTLHIQFLTMGMMFASGTGLGIIFDVYRVLTGQLRVPRWLISILDLIYWTLATFLVFQVLYSSNQGQLRLFVFIGLFAGATFYWAFLRVGTVRVIMTLLKICRWLIDFGKKLIEIFIVTPIQWFYKCLLLLISFLAALALFVYKIVLQLLYPVVLLIVKPVLFLWRQIRWPSWVRQGWHRVRNIVRKWFAKK